MLGLTILVAMAMHPPADAYNRSSDRGLYVFGYTFLDTRAEKEQFGLPARLTDCSTREHYCADGRVFNVVLPKVCPQRLQIGTIWREGGLETTVVGESDDMWGRSRIYFLQSNQQPDVIYAYAWRSGIPHLYYDPRGQTDYVAMAKAGTLDAFDRAIRRDPARDHLVLDLINDEIFAGCTPHKPRVNR